jgi:hypothetical protein
MARSAWVQILLRRRRVFFQVLCPEALRVDAGAGDAAKDLICLLRGRDPFFELNLFSLFQGGPHCDDIGIRGTNFLFSGLSQPKPEK